MSAPAPAPPPRSLDSLRVALVHDWLTGMRGGEKCLEVLCEMFPDAPIYTLVHWKGRLSPTIESHPIHESWIAKMPLGRSCYRWYIASFPKAIESFDLSGYDLVVSISHCAAKGVITRADTLHVCYCNTPVRYFWDLASEYFAPGRARMIERLIGPPIAHQFRLWDRISSDRVDLFIGNSFNIRDRIRKHYRRPALAVYPPVDTDFFTPAPAAASDDAPFLTVSALVPYKGVDLTIRAANNLGAALHVIGSGPDRARLRAIAGPTVRFEEWVSMEELRDAYRGCRALIQAHEEDFGIAPLEALACGRPAVALAKGGALETLTPDTGVLFREATEAALTEAMREVMRQRYDPASLRRQALLFGRERYRSEMRSVLERAYRAHLLRHEDPEGIERPARACREAQDVI
ncbi:MAG TPA: glycosyltransferase [Methylomirabilota bacterium]|nr:glycosyltransferase [Methylomirabilota bacterium]